MAAIKGLDRFQAHFAGFEDQYVLIGGVACHLWFQDSGLNFRATKDLDVVLVTEALTPDFVRQVWDFVDLGRYRKKERSDREHRYYRFTAPEEPDFPTMIELFARRPEAFEIESGQKVVPVPMDEDVSSLSAILLDEDYYGLIRQHQHIVNGLPMVAIPALILLKAKAWLDLTARRASGEAVDTDHVSKHRSDVFRLTLLLQDGMHWPLPDSIGGDMQSFLAAFPTTSPEWDGIRASLKTVVSPAPPATALREALTNAFGLPPD